MSTAGLIKADAGLKGYGRATRWLFSYVRQALPRSENPPLKLPDGTWTAHKREGQEEPGKVQSLLVPPEYFGDLYS
jgi:hypothetical protein